MPSTFLHHTKLCPLLKSSITFKLSLLSLSSLLALSTPSILLPPTSYNWGPPTTLFFTCFTPTSPFLIPTSTEPQSSNLVPSSITLYSPGSSILHEYFPSFGTPGVESFCTVYVGDFFKLSISPPLPSYSFFFFFFFRESAFSVPALHWSQ